MSTTTIDASTMRKNLADVLDAVFLLNVAFELYSSFGRAVPKMARSSESNIDVFFFELKDH